MTHPLTDKTRRAWSFYRLGITDLKSINEALREEELDPISERSHRHLKALERYGIKEYMTINGFDQYRQKVLHPEPNEVVVTSPVLDAIEASANRAYGLARKMGFSQLVAKVFYDEVKKAEEDLK